MTVVCVGQATLDTVLEVPRYPASDSRVVSTRRVRAGGGPAATAAVALARLGIEVSFVGVIGDDDVGAEILDGLVREGVDVSGVAVARGSSPESVILVEGGSGERTIVHVPGAAPPLELDERGRSLCAGATWVHADHAGYAAVRGLEARISLDGGNPVDGLDLRGIALYAPTEAALREAFGSPEAALAAGADLVVVTRGAAGSFALTRAGERIDAPGLHVDVVSTLGAGDVFHGALLAQLVREASLADALAFANACAALSCRALDGRSAIPTNDEVAAWLIASH